MAVKKGSGSLQGCLKWRCFLVKAPRQTHTAATLFFRQAVWWWAVPAAVLLGVPMYTNAAGIIPIVEALIGKGAAVGTVLAFMMSVIALSAPEMIILRKALKPRLIATFAGVVALGILLVGYVFNLVL